MSSGVQFDTEQTRLVESIYTTSDVVAQREAVLSALDLHAGERVLDVGSGTGLLARAMALGVGAHGAVSGIDISASMIASSQRRCADLHWVEFRTGDATALEFPDAAFDVAVSTQVYEYVDDVMTALRELYRVLRPGGRAVIVDTDWDSLVWNAPDPARLNRVLSAFTEHCAHPFLARQLAPQLRRVGFEITAQSVFTLFNPKYHPDTYSYGIIDFIAKFVPGHQGVTAQEAETWNREMRVFGETDGYFFSLNRYFFSATKPA